MPAGFAAGAGDGPDPYRDFTGEHGTGRGSFSAEQKEQAERAAALGARASGPRSFAHDPCSAQTHRYRTDAGDGAREKGSGLPVLYFRNEHGEIDRAMAQFRGAFDGAAGPIRSVTGRTCDVLPRIARAAQIIHQGPDLQERVTRLLFRLDLGIQGAAVGLGRYAGRALDRSDGARGPAGNDREGNAHCFRKFQHLTGF